MVINYLCIQTVCAPFPGVDFLQSLGNILTGVCGRSERKLMWHTVQCSPDAELHAGTVILAAVRSASAVLGDCI